MELVLTDLDDDHERFPRWEHHTKSAICSAFPEPELAAEWIMEVEDPGIPDKNLTTTHRLL